VNQYTQVLTERYDKLSKQSCCLSCGGAFAMATVKPGFVCVDLGCGKGHDVLRMATMAGAEGLAYGVDISDGMIETAKKNAAIMGADNVRFLKSTLEEIKLDNAVADLVISNCTINHSLNQARVWKEISRILKPGGSFVVSDIFAIEPVPDIYRNDPVSVSECWAGAETKENYLRNIEAAGLADISVLEESAPYSKGEIVVASFTLKGIKP
jgi:ubiquinone/menaquinone biosynthesis C-methylase UbiE